jgi:hypothetical protein
MNRVVRVLLAVKGRKMTSRMRFPVQEEQTDFFLSPIYNNRSLDDGQVEGANEVGKKWHW